MNLYVLDTDILSLYHKGHLMVRQRVAAHPLDELAITVITVDEAISGWYTMLRQAKQPPQTARAYQELAQIVPFLGLWNILVYPESAITRYGQLAKMRLNIRASDLRIAAVVLENNAILVTRNTRDFKRVPGLTIEDWTM